MKKRLIINYSKSDFIKKYKKDILNDSIFKTDLPKFLNYFDITISDLKPEFSNEFEIQHDISDLLSLLIKSYKESPLCDGRYTNPKFNSSSIVDYNNRTIDDVEKLPDYLKHFIKTSENFKFNYSLSKLVPILLDRLTILFSTIATSSGSNAGNILMDLISSIDNWINSYSIQASQLDYYKTKTDSVICNIDSFDQINGKKDLGYSIDNVLRESFKAFYRPDNLKFNDDIPANLLNCLVKYDKTPTEAEVDELRKKYTNFLNSIYTDPKLLKNQEEEYKKINTYADSETVLSPDSFNNNKKDSIRFYIDSLNEILLKYEIGYSTNQFIDGINVSAFINKLTSCTHENLEKTIVAYAREIYEIKLKAVEMKYKLHKEMKTSTQNTNLKLIRDNFDFALGQTLIQILIKEYNSTNPEKKR